MLNVFTNSFWHIYTVLKEKKLVFWFGHLYDWPNQLLQSLSLNVTSTEICCIYWKHYIKKYRLYFFGVCTNLNVSGLSSHIPIFFFQNWYSFSSSPKRHIFFSNSKYIIITQMFGLIKILDLFLSKNISQKVGLFYQCAKLPRNSNVLIVPIGVDIALAS